MMPVELNLTGSLKNNVADMLLVGTWKQKLVLSCRQSHWLTQQLLQRNCLH